MDDIIYQSNNQNSVYVLNSSYRSYGDLERLNLIDPNDVNNKNVPNCQDATASRSGNCCCSAGSRAMQHKLHNLGNFCEVTEIIGNTVTSPPSLSVAALSTTTTTTTPPATRCLLPAAAFQTFFNCSYVANVTGAICTKVMHDDPCSGGCADASTAQGAPKIKPKTSNKKKCANVKPSVIAKKTKFRKFIEAEKWRTGVESAGENGYQQHRSNNDHVGCTGSITPTEFRTNSCVKESNAAESTTRTASMAAVATCGSLNNIVKHYWNNNKMEANAAGESKRHPQQNQSNNWSGSGDSNNQKRQQLEVLKSTQQQKSNYELYKEAAELLGLSCTLCDNCRCLECQSSYFDCDDSDSLSEFSNSDDYDEETMNALNSSIELVMHSNCYRGDEMTNHGAVTTLQRPQQQTAGPSEHQETWNDDRDKCKLTRNGHNNDNGACLTESIKQNTLTGQSQRSSVLENVSYFKELRLTDDADDFSLDTDNTIKG